MPSVRGVARLEGVHGIRPLGLELVHKLRGGLAPLIQAIIVADAIEQLHLPADQPVPARVDVLNVRMAVVDGAEHARHDLLLAVGVHLRTAQNGHGVPHLGHQRHGARIGIVDRLLGVVGTGQGDGDAHADALGGLLLGKAAEIGRLLVDPRIAGQIVRIDEEGVEVQRLQQCALAHESRQRGGPALADDLEPVQIDVGDAHLGQRLGLGAALRPQMMGNVPVDPQIAIGVGQRGRKLRRALQHAVPLEALEQKVRRLLDGHLVRLQDDLRMQRFLVRIVDAGEVFELAALDAGVLALGVALLQFVHRNVQKHLVKRDALILVASAHGIAVGAVRADQAHQGDGAAVGEQRGDLARPPHALLAVRLAEAQIAVQPRAQIIAVQAVHVLAVQLHQFILQRGGDGRLAGPRAARHPQGGPLLLQGGVARFGGQVAGGLRCSGLGGGAFDDVGGRLGECCLAHLAHVDVVGVHQALAHFCCCWWWYQDNSGGTAACCRRGRSGAAAAAASSLGG